VKSLGGKNHSTQRGAEAAAKRMVGNLGAAKFVYKSTTAKAATWQLTATRRPSLAQIRPASPWG